MSLFEIYKEVQVEMNIQTDNDFYSLAEKNFNITNNYKILEVCSQVVI
jgi:hypothetical protein